MSEVICISSSEDEDEVPAKDANNSKKNKASSNQSNKRKLSSDSSDESNSNKRFKPQDEEKESTTDKLDTNPSNNSFSSSDSSNWYKKSTAVDKRENVGSIYDIESPIAGTSKYFDEIEKRSFMETESTVSSKKQVSAKKETKIQINRILPKLIEKQRVSIPDPSDDIFANLLKASADDSRADDKIRTVIKGIKEKYDQLESFHKEDEEFRLFLNRCLDKIKNQSSKFYSIWLEVKQEVKRRFKKPKASKQTIKDKENEEEDEEIDEDEPVYTKDELKKLKKIENSIIKCREKIKQLERQEVNFDDDDNSVFIQEDRYKKRLIHLYEKYSQMTNDKMVKSEIFKKTIKLKDIPGEMTGISSVDEAILKFVNSSIKKLNELRHIKNPNSNPSYLEVPDYIDVLKIIRKQNETFDIGLSEKKMSALASTACKTLGWYLKKRRVLELKEQMSLYKYVDDNGIDPVDPAIKNPELREALDKNKDEGNKKLEAIFEKYLEIENGLTKEERDKQLEGKISDSDNESEEKLEIENKNEEERSESVSNEDVNNDNEENVSNEKEKAKNENKKKIIISSSEEEDDIERKEESKKESSQEETKNNMKNVKNDSGNSASDINNSKESSVTEKMTTSDKSSEKSDSSNKTLIWKTRNIESSKIDSSSNINDDVISLLSDDDSTDFSPKTNSVPNSQEIRENPDLVKKLEKSKKNSQETMKNKDSSENSNPNSQKIRDKRYSTETEDFVLVFESPDNEVLDKDPLENSVKSSSNCNAKSLTKATDITDVEKVIEKPPTKIAEKETSSVENITAVINKSSAKKTLNCSNATKYATNNDCIITLDNNSNSSSAKKSDFQKIIADKDKSTVTSQKTNLIGNKTVNNSSSITASPIISKELTTKEKLTNVVKPLQPQEVKKYFQLHNSSKTNNQFVEVTSSKQCAASKPKEIDEVEVIDCIEDEPKSKPPDSDVIVEKEKPVLKLKDFAGIPDSWNDIRSPEKPKQYPVRLSVPIQKALGDIPKPLKGMQVTSEKGKYLPSSSVQSTKMPNPFTGQKVLVINNVINVPISSEKTIPCQRSSSNTKQVRVTSNFEEKKGRSFESRYNPRDAQRGKFNCNPKSINVQNRSLANRNLKPNPYTTSTMWKDKS